MALKSYNNFATEMSYFAQFSYKDDILKYYLQGTQILPSITTGVSLVMKNGVNIPMIGGSRDLTPLSLSFITDEDFEIFTFLLDLQEQYRTEMTTVDFFEVYIQNNQNVNILKFVYKDIFFSSVTPPVMSTTGNETTIITECELNYSSFEYKRLN